MVRCGLALIVLVMLAAGCRSQQPVYDPFLGKTRIEPPGTAVPTGQPYYAPPSGTQFAPPVVSPGFSTGATAAPASISPSGFAAPPATNAGFTSTNNGGFSPNVSQPNVATSQSSAAQFGNAVGNPAARGTLPTTPVSNPGGSQVRPAYGPPGGMAYPPQTLGNPNATMPSAQPGMPQPLDVNSMLAAAPMPTGQPTPAQPSGVTQAGWTSAGTGSSAPNAVSAAAFTSPTDRNGIRIVEPAMSSTSRAPTPATVGGISSGTLNQQLNSARVPEISDLPVSRGTPPAMTPAAASTATAWSNAQPRTVNIQPASRTAQPTPAAASSATSSSASGNYGHDPQYRWLRGKLEYNQSTRKWRLRYLPADGGETDNFGGSVVLADASRLGGLTAGDLVEVQGSLGPSAGEAGSFAPLYNVQSVRRQ